MQQSTQAANGQMDQCTSFGQYKVIQVHIISCWEFKKILIVWTLMNMHLIY